MLLYNKLNRVICILVLINIIGVFINKDNWAVDVEEVGGWQNSLSKLLYAIVIIIMFPSLKYKSMNFRGAYNFSFIIIIYVFCGLVLGNNFDLGSVSKFLLLCLSFVFFEQEFKINQINNKLLLIYIISSLAFTSARIFSANVLANSIEDGDFSTGQSSSLSVIYLLPLIFYALNKKISTYIFIFGFILVLLSLRRTSIIAYLLCVPFVFSIIKDNLSKKFLVIILTSIGIGVYYFVSEYWWVIEIRFLDMFEANRDGYYGSGRTGWFEALMKIYLDHPENWIFGFGVGVLKEEMFKMGAAFGHAHNDYIEIIFTYGLLGLYLWYSMFIKFIQKVRRSNVTHFESKLSYMCIFSVLLIAMATNEIDDPTFIAVPMFMSLICKKYLFEL